MWKQVFLISWRNSLDNKIYDKYDTKKTCKLAGPISPRYKDLTYNIWNAISERLASKYATFF